MVLVDGYGLREDVRASAARRETAHSGAPRAQETATARRHAMERSNKTEKAVASGVG